MDIFLQPATKKDYKEIYQLQISAFQPLLEKYKDYSSNPSAEKIEKTIQRLQDPLTTYYFICLEEKHIGMIRISQTTNICILKQILIIPEYQEKGYAQKAIIQIEQLYSHVNRWELDTIMQEKKLCFLYEKMGYKKTGEIKYIKDGMDLIYYGKDVILNK